MTAVARRVGINACFLERGMGGLETYVREVVPALLEAAPDRRLTLVTNPRARVFLGEEDWGSSVRWVVPPALRLPATKAAYELGPLGLDASRRFDALLSPALTAPLATRAANVVVLADVTWLTVPDMGEGQAPTVRLWQTIVPPVARRADRAIAISRHGAQDVAEHLRVRPERIDTVYIGAGVAPSDVRTPEAELRASLGLDGAEVLLNVAAKKVHKNLLRLVRTMPAVRAARPAAKLVLVGPPTPHEEELKAEAERLGVADAVVFPGYVSREDLEGLYAIAAGFVFPSLNEGFGLPLLEAMAREVPVACADASALPEVAGDAALLFDPLDEAAMAAAIVRLLGDDALRARLVAAGRERPAAFTWRACAEGTLESLDRALAQKRRS